MPTREQNQAALDEMGANFLADVDATRQVDRLPPLSEGAKTVFRDLLNDPNGPHEDLLAAIDEGNLQMMMTPIGPGQGMYSAPSRALCIDPEALEQAAADPRVGYNLNFTLSHECRHARDGADISTLMTEFSQAAMAKAQEPGLPHDYTELVRDYLQRDRAFEQRAETAGFNAHVSKVIAEVGPHATQTDVYEKSPKDMAPYMDLVARGGLLSRDTYAYKPEFVTQANGLHLDAAHPDTLAAMGTHFYDAQQYDWRQGLKATLDIINNVEQNPAATRDPQQPPRIDLAALGLGPPPDAHCRGFMQRVVDGSLPPPTAPGHPDHAYFTFLQGQFPGASDQTVAHAMLQAKQAGLEDASRIDAARTAAGPDGRLWVTGTNDHSFAVVPGNEPPMARITQDLSTQALEQADARAQQAQLQRQTCVIL